MLRPKREIPHYYLRTIVDLTRMLAWLEAANTIRLRPQGLLVAALFLKSKPMARRLDGHPQYNDFFTADGVSVRRRRPFRDSDPVASLRRP